MWWSNSQCDFLHFSIYFLSLLHRKWHLLTSFFSSPLLLQYHGLAFPQVTPKHPWTLPREFPCRNPTCAKTEYCGTRFLPYFWRNTLVLLLPPWHSALPSFQRLSKIEATCMTVNIFKGSRRCLSLPLQWTLKVEIFSPSANHKQNWIALPGQDNWLIERIFLFHFVITKVFFLIKAEMEQWNHILNIWWYIYKNICLHSTTTKKLPQLKAHNSSSRYMWKTTFQWKQRGDTKGKNKTQ